MLAHPAPTVIHVTECLAAGTLGFLVQAARELSASGVNQVLLFSRRHDTPADVETLFDKRIQLVEIDPPGWHPLRYARSLRKALAVHARQPGPVCVHFHSSKAGFAGRLAMLGWRRAAADLGEARNAHKGDRLPRPRMLYSPHGLSFLDQRLRAGSPVFAALEWLAARVDCTLVACSESEAQALSKATGRHSVVLENPVDDSFLRLPHHETAPALVLSIGRVCHQKAPEVFAALAARFKIAEIPARFVWVGNGDPASEAELRASGVEVTGWVGRDEVQRLLSQAAVYVQTSRWEGMPLSVLQALAAGVPCVVTDAVGNRDAVREGITGFVAQNFDELLLGVNRLMRERGLRQRFSLAARRDAQARFSSPVFRRRLCQLYGFAEHAGTGLAYVPAEAEMAWAETQPPD